MKTLKCTVLVLAIAAFAAVSAGCASAQPAATNAVQGGSTTANAPAATPDTTSVKARPGSLTGTWEGRWSWTQNDGTIILRLVQNGTEVRGTWEALRSGVRTFHDLPVEGSINGSVLVLKAPSQKYRVLRAIVDLESGKMEGTYWWGKGESTFTATKK